ncbi:methyltransferase domain-containing protein [Aquamicrobium sp. LC103]|uniref:methyltransferase domain-containing protein n=1 Tax=Aquamicrobium sp. LC103 TaxID=1120658 RepID=UPI00069C7FA0|nr:methyltransferase domain-containing protein [Aquamicrobium sp. LC103]TKT77461.1 class I SAM-dependent methyltransferase [Aquamicrobium sp. LC103]
MTSDIVDRGGLSAPVEVEERASIKLWHRLYGKYVAPRFRGQRMALFQRLMQVSDRERIIDLGGAEDTWKMIAAEPSVTMVNLWGEAYRHSRFVYEIGDACDLGHGDKSFDIAFSNSVIEHVGDWERQRRFAAEIRRVAPRYFVQTPNRYFPIEPHYMCLGIQFLPTTIFKKLLPWLSLWGLTIRPSREEIDASVAEIRLLTKDEMRELFPDAEIIEEKFLGMTKSIVAVRR